MADTDKDDGFDEAFKGFGEDPAPVPPPATPPVDPPDEPAAAPRATEPPVEPPKPTEEPKKDEKPEETTPVPAADETKPAEGSEPPKTPETPAAPAEEEAPKPLTKDDVNSVVRDLLNSERSSSKELETATQEVLEAYYPGGLSNVLQDESGKELRTPTDVVEASGGKMTTEEATQWLMNEQYKLDQAVAKIKDDAKQIAETTVNFKRDSITALQKYEPLFKAYPQLQQKVWEKLMKQVKVDKDKDVILSAPDVMEHYDDYLEPYQQAFEYATNQPATNPTAPTTPEPPKPSAEDRMDEGGDGGTTPVDDPNDFAQQVTKELAKGM